MKHLMLAALCLTTTPGFAQEDAPARGPAIVKAVQDAARAEESPEAARRIAQTAALAALEEHAAWLSKGEGLHYKGQLLLHVADGRERAVACFAEHGRAAKDTPLGQESLLISAALSAGDDQVRYFEMVDAAKLPERARRLHVRLAERVRSYKRRAALHGRKAPALEVRKVLNGPPGLTLAGLRGKVVVIDFWATWCAPCRELVPALVTLQEEKGGPDLQVVGATRFYGTGMDFSGEDAEVPHGGASRRGLDEKAETAVNEAFIEAFGVNYPVVFTAEDVAAGRYEVTGVPTLFVIGRDGKVVGHVVGGSDASHEKLLELVGTALRDSDD